MIRAALLSLTLLVAACAPRGQITLDPAAAAVGQVRSVYVATNRGVDPATGLFDAARERDRRHFARYDVAVPPDRDLGQLTWPRRGRAPDPRRDFLTVAAEDYPDGTDFRTDLAAALARQPRGSRDAVVFIHGFNTTFAEGLYRIAQMSHDLEIPGVPVYFAWPSAAQPLGYVRDLDSATLSRSALRDVLNEVAAARPDRIVLIAHSMGSQLTMETLRTLRLSGNRAVLDRIGGVLLIAPDIDLDVFYEQARASEPLPQPFVIFTSQRDRALLLSARLTGLRGERLGNIRDVAEIGSLKVTVVDVAAFSVGAGHFNVGNSPALIRILSRVGEVSRAYGADAAVRTGLLPGVVLTVQNATQIVLSPVAGMANALRQ